MSATRRTIANTSSAYATAAQLVNELAEAADERRLSHRGPLRTPRPACLDETSGTADVTPARRATMDPADPFRHRLVSEPSSERAARWQTPRAATLDHGSGRRLPLLEPRHDTRR
jgi:hypothetical protein